MEINDSQRCKVAKELRSESEGWRDCFPDATPEGDGIDAAIMFDLIRFVGLDDQSPVHAIYARLADLIDRPTCKNKTTYGNVFNCSNCGYKVEVISHGHDDCAWAVTTSLEPRFCPVCGAEVVE